jgi:hypothetical protein
MFCFSKVSLFCFIFFCINSCNSYNLRSNNNSVYENNENNEFIEFLFFKEKFSKKYDTIEIFTERFNIFKTNLKQIILHNLNKSHSFTMTINKFTDLTPNEFRATRITGLGNLKSYGCKSFSSNGNKIENSIDWRNKGVVSKVKDQGQCGSCWAFATVANAESVWAIEKGVLLDLSEQEIVDCAKGTGYWNMGCNGGNPDSSFKYMIDNGLTEEKQYPYVSGVTKTEGKCHTYNPNVFFSNCYDVTPYNQLSLKYAVYMNPVVVAIEADTNYFQSYSSGILTSKNCGTNLDHAVEIVGYGTENNVDYWVVRNSWGEDWGEGGYVRILRISSTNDIGVCGIGAQPSFLQV